jgi:molybdopterin/thiamine biosynthesis adenylyltransferase
VSAGEVIELPPRDGPVCEAMTALDRSARSPRLVDAPRDLRAALCTLAVVIIGCGSIGQHLARLVAQLGVRSLLLIDRARLKPESFLTHPCAPADLGRAKALVAGELAKALSPPTRVQVFHGSFDDVPSDQLADRSVLLLASDNLQCEVSAGQRAMTLGIPLLQGAVHGSTLVADVRSFANRPGCESPCPACSYQHSEWDAYDRGTRFSCSGETEIAAGSALPSLLPTTSFPQLCSLAADLTLMELTRRLVGLADPDESRVVQFSGYTQRATATPLRRRDDCPIDHEALRVVGCGEALAGSTLRELLGTSGLGGENLERITLQIEAHRYAGFASCSCREHPALGRFYRSGETPGRCPHCDAEREFHPLHTREEIPVSLLLEQLDRPLAALGASRARALRLRGERGGVLFHRGAQPSPETIPAGDTSQ